MTPERERDLRLQTVMLMTGMDHLVDLMEEQNSIHQQRDGSQSSGADIVEGTSEFFSMNNTTFLRHFDSLVRKFSEIEEKLQSIQLAHFELQHTCSSANEVAQQALQDYQRGNPYLSKIDNILSHQSEHDATERFISAAQEMIDIAKRDVRVFLNAFVQSKSTVVESEFQK